MLSALFPTLLAVYISIGLWFADALVKSYDSDPDHAFHAFRLPTRVGTVTALAVAWPITIPTVVVIDLVVYTAERLARRGV